MTQTRVENSMLNTTARTRQVFLSGSGTYTTPAGVKSINIRMVGGGGGGYIEHRISPPAATYAYSVGAGGTGGPAGAGGFAGGNGAAGIIIVDEFYQ